MFEGKAPWVIGGLGFILLLGAYFDGGESSMNVPYPMNVIMPAVFVFCSAVIVGLIASYIFKRDVDFDTRLRHGSVVGGLVSLFFVVVHFT